MIIFISFNKVSTNTDSKCDTGSDELKENDTKDLFVP